MPILYEISLSAFVMNVQIVLQSVGKKIVFSHCVTNTTLQYSSY